MGIYLDDNSSQVDVLNNTIIGSSMNFYLHNTLDIKLENNHLIGAISNSFLIRNHLSAIFSNIFFTDNTIVGGDLLWQYSRKDNSNDVDDSNYNIFRGSNASKMFKVHTPSTGYASKTFDEWEYRPIAFQTEPSSQPTGSQNRQSNYCENPS